ncbi:polysaccharide pyruvyl transferase family protein [Marinococcus sp. PL1-022]|uniref:polysaccharide pyruvyl transferase family protein n=1 Tax=Marinococcus sp. PL1-022 TaxID=3095363 RepID=UPI0029C11013|nr:polysaccharide pyruvyl transferase family protein [Marinococcus sp. PL1-022]MDX6153984.1 polysaccharide pyruvyl transferase family protein [Marinococcus sp. PL1-022]
MLEKPFHVLHIASFHGNIGDNANHKGFRKMFEYYYPGEVQFEEIEMRDFYRSWNLRSFESDEFINTCNEYDLVVVGGGNFFELKWDYSVTGTTINISNSALEKIETPILFNSLGCDIAKGASQEAIDKFKRFLDYSLSSSRIYISLRNDGSYKTIDKLYGKEYAEKINIVPDGAFFAEFNTEINTENLWGQKLIGINVVSDMSEVRFNTSLENTISYEEYMSGLGKVLNDFLSNNKEYNILLFPHIYSDLKAIYDLMTYIDDKHLRFRIKTAPLLTGEGAEDYIFSLYQKCTIILGMRFHSNVCAISQNIPTIALSSYKKIDDLYEELGITDRVVKVNEKNFQSKLIDKLAQTLNDPLDVKKVYEKVNKKNCFVGSAFYKNLVNEISRNRIEKSSE